jgi:hypothetical protein
MANSYYNKVADISNTDVSDASDINNIDDAVDAGFDAVETAVTAASSSVNSVNAKQYAVGTGNIYDQVTPNDTNPTYSSKTEASNAKQYGTAAEDTDIQNLVLPVTGTATYSAKHWAAKAAADLVLTNADVVSTNADVVTTNADVVLTNADVVSTNADVVLAEAAAATIPAAQASKAGALIVQNTDDATFDLLATQGTDGYPLVSNGADAVPAFEQVTATGLATDSVTAVKVLAGEGILNSEIAVNYVKVSDVKASSVEGGTFTLGAWRTRDINTEDTDTDSLASISSNQVTLEAGTYRCLISCPASSVGRHQAKLYDITGTADLLLGSSAFTAGTGDGDMTDSIITGQFTLAVQSVLEIQHQGSATQADSGFGFGTTWGNGVFTVAEFWKVA